MKRVLVLSLVLALAGCGRRSAAPTARTLSAENADHRVAGYSPDGRQIYWWQRAGDAWRLYRSPADMSAPESLSVATQSPDGQLFWSPDGSRFAIGLNAPLPSVWLVNATGAAPRRLTAGGVFAVPFGWNPDGRRLLYGAVIDRNVYTMVVDVDSGVPTRLLPNETSPHVAFWSGDGSKLAVQRFGQGRATIWLADSGGGHLRQATTEGFENLNGYPTPWSPDGSALLYTSNRTGTSDVWVLPVDGTPPRQLTNDVRDDWSPSWSADGRWIAFQSNRGRQDDLWVVPAAGGEARRVTDDTLSEGLLGWRPGSEQLVYTTGRDRRTLWAHTIASGNEHRLTPDSLRISGFNVSSRGQVEVAIDRGGGVSDIAIMPIGGGAPRIILHDARSGGGFWSPDGSKLAFISSRAGANQHAWVMDADGGNLRQLTSWTEADNGVVFTDNSTLYVHSSHDARFGDLWRVPASGGEPTRVTRTGGVVGLCWQSRRPGEAIVAVVADAPVNIASARLRPGGVLQPLWDRSAWANCPLVSPASDSAAVPTSSGADVQTMLLPLGGGRGRAILEQNQVPVIWSPDGRQLLFTYTRNAPFDLGILTVADGTTRRITRTPESEVGTEWSADGSTLVFIRVVPVNRITTVDLSRLLAKRQP